MTTEQSAAVADLAGALSHPLRVRIVRELASGSDDGVRFTELRDAVGLQDNGRFNYHLDGLREGLVESAGDRYALTPTGREVAHVLRVSHASAPERRRSIRTESSCLTCGGRLVLTCRPHRIHVECVDCAWHDDWAIRPPPAAFEAPPGAAVPAVDRTIRDAGRALADGRCPTCLGPAETGLAATERPSRSLDVAATADCPDCGRVTATPGLLALAHDATAGFFHEADLALADRPVWDLAFVATDQQTRVRSRDPWRVEVRPQLGSEELVLLVDETASVSAVKRHTKFAARDVWYPNRVRS